VIAPTPELEKTAVSRPFAQSVYDQLGLKTAFFHVYGPPTFDQTLSPAPARPPANVPKTAKAISNRCIDIGELR
jgi:hypothetical protein